MATQSLTTTDCKTLGYQLPDHIRHSIVAQCDAPIAADKLIETEHQRRLFIAANGWDGVNGCAPIYHESE